MDCTFSVLPQKSLPMPRSQRCSSRNFIVLVSIFKSMFYFEFLHIVQDNDLSLYFLIWIFNSPNSIELPGIFCQKLVGHKCKCLIVEICILSHWSVYPFTPTTLSWLLWLYSKIKIRRCKSSSLFFFKIVLATLVLPIYTYI